MAVGGTGSSTVQAARAAALQKPWGRLFRRAVDPAWVAHRTGCLSLAERTSTIHRSTCGRARGEPRRAVIVRQRVAAPHLRDVRRRVERVGVDEGDVERARERLADRRFADAACDERQEVVSMFGTRTSSGTGRRTGTHEDNARRYGAGLNHGAGLN